MAEDRQGELALAFALKSLRTRQDENEYWVLIVLRQLGQISHFCNQICSSF